MHVASRLLPDPCTAPHEASACNVTSPPLPSQPSPMRRCLEEQKNPGQPAQVAPTDVAAVGVSPPAARPAAVEDQPLISFD